MAEKYIYQKKLSLSEMESTIWVQLLDESIFVWLHVNGFRKGMNPSLPSTPSYG